MSSFDEPEVLGMDDDGGTAIAAVTRGEIDVQISTAKKYPRNEVSAKKKMQSIACMDEETAEACFYSLPRGGKNIEGPSIRLAEIAVACYQNLRAGSRVVATNVTGDNPHVVVQAVCHDLENNVAITIEKRRRVTKKKKADRIDEDDINLAVNACAAIALRDAVFKIVPLAIIKPVFRAARAVAIGDATTFANKRATVLDKLQKRGALLPNILGVLEVKSIEEIDYDKLGTLIGIGTAIADGQTTVDAAFPSAAPAGAAPGAPGQSRADQLAERMLGKKNAGGKGPTQTTEPPKQEATKSDDEQNNQAGQQEGHEAAEAEEKETEAKEAEKPAEAAKPERTANERKVVQNWMNSIGGTQQLDGLDVLAEELEGFECADDIRQEITALIMRRRAELTPKKKAR